MTAYSRALGRKLEQADGTPVEGGTEPAPDTPADIAKAQQRRRVCQWAVPALTAGIIGLNALHGEQQRPQQQLPGVLATPARLLGLAGTPRSARRPALRAVVISARVRAGRGCEQRWPARFRTGSRGSVAARGRDRGGCSASAWRQQNSCGARCPYPGKDRGRLAVAGMRHDPPRRRSRSRRPVTMTDSSNDEARTEGRSNGHPVEVQSEVQSA